MNQEFDQPENPDKPGGNDSPPQEKRFGYLLVAFLLGVILPVAPCVWTVTNSRAKFQAEAVKGGHAIYKVVDDYGRTEFQWLPVSGAPTEKK